MNLKHKKSYSITFPVIAYTGDIVNKINSNNTPKFKGSIFSYIQIILKKHVAKHGDMYLVSKQFKTPNNKIFHKGDYIVFVKSTITNKISYKCINK